VSPFLSWVLLRFSLAMMDSSKNCLGVGGWREVKGKM